MLIAQNSARRRSGVNHVPLDGMGGGGEGEGEGMTVVVVVVDVVVVVVRRLDDGRRFLRRVLRDREVGLVDVMHRAGAREHRREGDAVHAQRQHGYDGARRRRRRLRTFLGRADEKIKYFSQTSRPSAVTA
jgi:hypothetical protein